MSDVVEGFRLSPQQRSLWRHLEREGPLGFRAQVAALVRGPVEPDELRAALERAVARHEILRTRLRRLPGVKLPVQVIGDPAPVPLEVIDARGEPADSGPVVVDRQVARLAARPLDAAGDGPLVEAAWIDFGGEDDGRAGALLLGVAPGLVDAAALEHLLVELLEDCAGIAPPVGEGGEGPLQYADLAEWQNELLEGDEGREGVAVWRRMGLSPRPPLDLPLAGPAGGRFTPALAGAALPRSEGGGDPLADAAQALGLGPEHLALAAWLVLLWRRSGHEERLLGVGLDGRGYEELDRAVGLFERELPLSIAVRPDEPGGELARRVAGALEELAGRQETFAWERAVDAAGEPALPVGFGVDDHREVHRAGALSLRVLRRTARVQPSVVRAVLVTSPGTTGFELHHDATRLTAAAAARLAAELASLTAQLAHDPALLVSELDATLDPATGARHDDVLAGAATPGPDYPREATVHGLIAERAAARPDAVAVRCGDDELTYAELERRADGLARRLAALGAGPDQRVGVCVERSTELIVSLLGVLRSGAGYVPVDPAYPAERVAFLLGDAGCRGLVTRRALLSRLPSGGPGGGPGDSGESQVADVEVVTLEDLPAAAGDQAEPRPADPASLAYVIYTSGSTGTPKGVEVTHRNLVHSTAARTSFYGDDPDRYLLVSSYAFDSSVAGIFWTLCTGGTLVLPEEGQERDVRELARLIEAERVTCTLMLPSLWNLLLDHGGRERLTGLERVIVAGEACPRDLVAKHRRLLPGCALVNEYGPTEGTVWSSAFDCAALGPDGPVPIGRPIPRTAAYLLDERQRPVPPGAPGELWVGGEGVARGYLARPELSEERFRPDPFAAELLSAGPGARMYRTGDLARRLPDGALEFLGRVDHQVKVRGYRVELGEIEEVLSAHPLVGEAVCLAREDTPGDQRLVAYVTAAGAEAPPETELGPHLRQRLPDYMVPQAFVVLDDLPRTPNGKVDRAALPAPEASRSALSSEYRAPETALERAFAEVWAEVLDVPRVGLADDFFELGGHSILAVRLAARLGETLGVEVGLRALFDAPTIGGLLAALRADPRSGPALQQAQTLLAEVEGLSDDEVEAALGGGEPEPGR